MIKQRDIIFHIEENECGINVEAKVKPHDAIIILDALFRTFGAKGIIGTEETKEEIEG